MPRRSDIRWLDSNEMIAWRTYVDTLVPLQQQLEGDLAGFGLTMGDYEVLVRLSEHDDRRLRMCDLAVELRLSPSGLTRRLDGLARHGLVAREPSPADGRVMMAVLTDAGYELLVRAAPTHVASVRRLFIDVLTPEEVAALGSAFTKVRAGLVGQDAPS
ncbi:MAG: MarR family winged helix-turn-helix transcriptional regulator [Ilumatobacteraceae bacterium]|jgi:DNA-binding MarR family transcriptional regulator